MLSETDSDDDNILLLTVLLLKNREKRRKIWVHDINGKRKEHGEYHRFCKELESHEDRFYIYFRMSKECFEELHETLRPVIEKKDSNWRRPISSRERLAICLRYLATGDSYQTIAFSFRVGRTTVGSIIKELCNSMWMLMQPIYIPDPDENTWKQAEVGYREIWNFPNCVGSIDGKHITIKCPPNSGSEYFCYKNFHSIVLLAIVDPHYKFLVVDIGNYGRHSDSGIFEHSNFYRDYIYEKNLLPPKPLPGTDEPIPHVLIGDEGFALQPYLMRPFPRSTVLRDERKKLYNYRLCRARRVVENTFGILSQKWRIFLRPIECDVETAIHVVKAACCLHNYIRTKQGVFVIGQGEVQTPEVSPNNLLRNVRPTNRRSPNVAFEIKEKFVNYFNQN